MRAIHAWLLLTSLPLTAAATPYGWTPVEPYDAPVQVSDTRREYYAPGENAQRWSERVSITSYAYVPHENLAERLERLHEPERARCPELRAYPMPGIESDRAREMVEVWICPRNTETGRGELSFVKALVDGERLHVLRIEGSIEPVVDKLHLPDEQARRWLRVLGAFDLCDGYYNLACLPAWERIAAAPVRTLSLQQSAAAETVEALGAELYRQNQIAGRGSELLKAKLSTREINRGVVFVALPDATRAGGKLYVFDAESKTDDVRWVVEFGGDGRGKTRKGRAEDATPDVLVRRRALLAGLEAMSRERSCTPHVNTAVLQAPGSREWLVYLLLASTKPGEIWLGRHARVRVASDGRTVVATDYSTPTCVALSAPERGASGARHFLAQKNDDLPWETVVYQSSLFQIPVYVGTRGGVWRVVDGHVAELELGD